MPFRAGLRESKEARCARGFAGYASAVGVVATATALSYAGRAVLAVPDIVMLYMLGIMLVAARFGRGPSSLAAALSVASYDFFVVPPVFEFVVDDTRHLLTFATMFTVGLIMSGLTSRIRRQEQQARSREARTAALYALSRELGSAANEKEAAGIVARHAARVFERGAAVAIESQGGGQSLVATAGDVPFGGTEQQIAEWAFTHAEATGRGTAREPSDQISCFPLRTGSAVVGVLVLASAGSGEAPSDDLDFIDAFAHQGALTIVRVRLAEEAKSSALRAETEQMRSSLLSTVSHDFRTPLAAITGAATTLRDDAKSVSTEQRADLVVTICEEAERLERLVGNLLHMTRVESGSLEVKREWISLEELLASAVARVEPTLGGRAVPIELPEELLIVSVDALLLEQVFVNLLENAAKYTPPEGPIEIRAKVSGDSLVIDVADHGPGIAADRLESIFEKFSRGTHPGRPGAGLGLPICRGIVQAHGGTLVALARPEGGAVLRMSLPIATNAPPLPLDSSSESLEASA